MEMWPWNTANQRTACALLDAEKESDMARQTQSKSALSLDRRQLLTSVAVVTTAGLAPIAESSRPGHLSEAPDVAELAASDVPRKNEFINA
jgi:hypothetical protein